jgi:putative transposase
MVLSLVTALAGNLVMVSAAVLRSRVAKDAEVLALRHENAVLRRQIAGPLRAGRSDPAGRAVAVGPSRATARGLRGHADHAVAPAPGTRRA